MPEHVDAREVEGRERPIAKPKFFITVSTRFGRDALFEQVHRFARVVEEHPVADEPNAFAETTATLRNVLPSFIAGRQRLRRGSLPRTISSSFMMFAGAKKCSPTNVLRAASSIAAIASTSRVEVFVARIAPGLQIASSFSKTCFLIVHVFEHRLDHDVGVGERIVVASERDRLAAASRLLPGSAGRAALGARTCRTPSSWRARSVLRPARPRRRECRRSRT